jgi:predicted transcriptional regulator
VKPFKGFRVSNRNSDNLLETTSMLVAAFLQHNNLAALESPTLIRTTYDSLAKLGTAHEVMPAPKAVVGAVSLRTSLASPDPILSMIHTKPYRTLKRHIGMHRMTPETYRDRYKLPHDCPMVASGYAAERNAMAKHIGFGRKPATALPPAPPRHKLRIVEPKG